MVRNKVLLDTFLLLHVPWDKHTEYDQFPQPRPLHPQHIPSAPWPSCGTTQGLWCPPAVPACRDLVPQPCPWPCARSTSWRTGKSKSASGIARALVCQPNLPGATTELRLVVLVVVFFFHPPTVSYFLALAHLLLFPLACSQASVPGAPWVGAGTLTSQLLDLVGQIQLGVVVLAYATHPLPHA